MTQRTLELPRPRPLRRIRTFTGETLALLTRTALQRQTAFDKLKPMDAVLWADTANTINAAFHGFVLRTRRGQELPAQGDTKGWAADLAKWIS